MKVTVLGCGSSFGMPGVNYGWGSCDPKNPKNRRTRPSILVEDGETRILIDTSPDLRQQLLSNDIRTLTALFYTHYHADHLHGIDDLRAINQNMNADLPVYCDKDTLKVIEKRFGYVLEPIAEGANFYYKPTLDPQIVENKKSFRVDNLTVFPYFQDHGYCDTVGFKFDNRFAYSTDVVALTDQDLEALKGVGVWIIGVLTDQPHETHADVEKALTWIEAVKPGRAYLTHLGPALDYDKLNARLPTNVEPAYDNLVIHVS